MALTENLMSLYQYYTVNGITNGLSDNQPYFTLNNQNISIYSGAMHYFRVPPEYWRDRLKKIRAAGLNCVETYIPWNLHEPQNGTFDFGNGGSDFEKFLNIEKFLKIVKEEDLFAIIRPGPFICSEWEFGGFPSWLLREKNIKLRTSNNNYMKYVKRYFNMLLPILAYFQFTKGGPIIAFQIENEYGSTEQKGIFKPDRIYLQQLRQLMLDNGIVELLVTSDSPTAHGDVGTLPGVFLQTANFASNPKAEFDKLKQLQPGKPIMAMEFWTGWFDHWSEKHNTRSDSNFFNILENILTYPASVNMYMFHGGTSYGFMNGANINNDRTDNSGYQPDTTSYDYDAPLSESGDYTVKYVVVKELIAKHNPIKTLIPETPSISLKETYPNVSIDGQLLLSELLNKVPLIKSEKPLSMEWLPINNNSGQSYGYIIYQKTLDIPADATLKIGGRICDTVLVLINGYLLNKPLTTLNDLNKFGYWRISNSTITLTTKNLFNATLELIVENWGRNNFGYLQQFNQFKGIWQDGIYLNNNLLKDWNIYPLEFKKNWNNKLNNFHKPINQWNPGPALYVANFIVHDIKDTFILMDNWTKGIVIINDFVLGRYAKIGPQQTLYLPGPFLKIGLNKILIFEHFIPSTDIRFSKKPVYYTAPSD